MVLIILIITTTGITTTQNYNKNLVEAQLNIITNTCDFCIDQITKHKQEIINLANQQCQSMVKRGGGCVDLFTRKIPRTTKTNNNTPNYWIILHVVVDCCDAMGANVVNSVAEGICFLSRHFIVH